MESKFKFKINVLSNGGEIRDEKIRAMTTNYMLVSNEKYLKRYNSDSNRLRYILVGKSNRQYYNFIEGFDGIWSFIAGSDDIDTLRIVYKVHQKDNQLPLYITHITFEEYL